MLCYSFSHFPGDQATTASLLTLPIIMTIAGPWLLIRQKPTAPMAVGGPSSAVTSPASRLGLQKRTFTELLTDANVSLSLS